MTIELTLDESKQILHCLVMLNEVLKAVGQYDYIDAMKNYIDSLDIKINQELKEHESI